MESIVSVKSTIPKQVPSFIEDDHPLFVKFVEAYFEYIERENGPVSFVRNALNYIDPSVAMDEFITNFFEEMKDIPQDILANKQLLAQHVFELFQAKGTIKGYQLLFRILFNEDIEVYLPKFDLLRPSDGKWVRDHIIRSTISQGNPFDLIGKEIYQLDEFAVKKARARVENIIYLENLDVYDVYVSGNSILGEFSDELITSGSVDIIPQLSPKFTPKLSRGSGYALGDRLKHYDSNEFDARVVTIKGGPITKVIILDGGEGHTVGEHIPITSSTGEGADLRVESVVDGKITSIRIVDGGQGYQQFIQFRVNDNGCFIAVGDSIGGILDISVKDPGVGHTSPPISSIDTVGVISNPSTGFVSNEPIELLPTTILTEEYSGFLLEDGDVILTESQPSYSVQYTIGNVTCNTAKFSGFFGSVELNQEDDYGILLETGSKLIGETSNGSIAHRTIRGTLSGAVARVIYLNPADIDSTLYTVFDTGARFINDDGKLSEFTKRIQDSRYYQEFSYVIKSGFSIKDYRSTIYKLMHPAGTTVFGAINVQSLISVVAKVVSSLSSTVLKILEIYFNQSKSVTFHADITSIVSLDQSKSRDYSWVETNKFYFGPQQVISEFYVDDGYVEIGYLTSDTLSIVGVSIPYLNQMRDVASIADVTNNYNTPMEIFGNVKFDQFYSYAPDMISYYPRNTKTRFTWESEITIS